MMKTPNKSAIFAVALAFVSLGASAAGEVSTYLFMGTENSANGSRYGYIYINDDNDVKPTRVILERYTDAGTRKTIGDTELGSGDIFGDKYYRVVLGTAANAFRLRMEYDVTTTSTNDAGETTSTTTTTTKYSYYSDNGAEYIYGSDGDVPYTWSVGYGGVRYLDKGHGNVDMNLGGTIYYKGFGLHATAKLYFTLPAAKYNRFVTMCGIQYNQAGIVNYQLTLNGVVTDLRNDINKSNPFLWDYSLADDLTSLKIDIDQGANNGNDHSSLGGLRFYLSTNTNRKAQTIDWDKTVRVHAFKDTALPLTAKASSGLPVFYRIVSGGDIATLDDSGNIRFNKTTSGGTVVVEAYQPGSDKWAMAPIATCTYNVTNSYVVNAGQSLELKSGEIIDELIVINDGVNTGQVTTKGLVQVGTLTYKQKVTPNRPVLITFPSDMDLDKVSNLGDLGYKLNTVDNLSGYTLKEYYTQKRAEQEDFVDQDSNTGDVGDVEAEVRNTPRRVSDNTTEESMTYWKTAYSSHIKGNRGYMLTLNNTTDSNPVEVVYTLRNSALDLNNGFDGVNMTFDFTTVDPGTVKTLYISPKNVAGNTLKVEMTFSPENRSELPLNYRDALYRARVTFSHDRNVMRITLPTSEPAKLVIYDKSGKHLKKAIRYVSPFAIDISDLKDGDYTMYVSYGNAVAQKQFSIER